MKVWWSLGAVALMCGGVYGCAAGEEPTEEEVQTAELANAPARCNPGVPENNRVLVSEPPNAERSGDSTAVSGNGNDFGQNPVNNSGGAYNRTTRDSAEANCGGVGGGAPNGTLR